jgi:hypothetical protein
MVRVNQAVNVLVEEGQVVEEVKATEARIAEKLKAAQEAKAAGVHLHPVE